MSFAERNWYRVSAISVLLLPASLLFRLAVWIRRALYRAGALSPVRMPVPVIVVGNLTVGGTGKTPLVLWLVRQLLAWGLRPGIVSRGYAGTSSSPREVLPGDSPALVGDEPLVLAERSNCPVWIGASRSRAAAALLAARPGCNIIVSDDGLQHYRLGRDLEIAVQDERGAGNGFMLPAGPLREPRNRQVDAVVINSSRNPEPDGRPARALRAPAFRMQLVPADPYHVIDRTTLRPAAIAGKRLHAVAGIGNPERFFLELEGLGLKAVRHAFPDHHRFVPQDLQFPECDYILMTEKDAVKCRGFGRNDLIAVPVDAVPDPALAELIRKKIHGPPSA